LGDRPGPECTSQKEPLYLPVPIVPEVELDLGEMNRPFQKLVELDVFLQGKQDKVVAPTIESDQKVDQQTITSNVVGHILTSSPSVGQRPFSDEVVMPSDEALGASVLQTDQSMKAPYASISPQHIDVSIQEQEKELHELLQIFR
jgi:hypothetical protein